MERVPHPSIAPAARRNRHGRAANQSQSQFRNLAHPRTACLMRSESNSPRQHLTIRTHPRPRPRLAMLMEMTSPSPRWPCFFPDQMSTISPLPSTAAVEVQRNSSRLQLIQTIVHMQVHCSSGARRCQSIAPTDSRYERARARANPISASSPFLAATTASWPIL